ncbi:MAG: metalloregulator ArsR/SmtB family transcription factor [Robiginitomaculum sp.]|nr:metalloregulator ArsR/SmtB family transcription factor [Robiginitomaculum sp.]
MTKSVTEQMINNVGNAADVLKALSNETRIKLMCMLMDGEKSAGELAKGADMRLPAISQHLAKMRAAGLVTSRREAQTIYYKAKDGVGHAVVGTLCDYYKG